MKLYADDPARRTRQQLLDAGVLVLAVGLVQVGRAVHDAVDSLAAPGRSLRGGGTDLGADLAGAARAVGGVPYAGDALRTPLDRAAQASRQVAEAGAGAESAAHHLALVLALAISVIPLLYVLGRWLPNRLSWLRDAAAVERLRADVDLLALRAATHAPLPALATLGPEPVGRWRRGEPGAAEALADLTLVQLGLRPQERGRAGQGADAGRRPSH